MRASAPGNSRSTVAAMAFSTTSRAAGSDRIRRLSQYIGLFIPLAHGSDFIVVGRPITAAADPVAAYRRCVEDFTGEL